ncbi:hypothetical protein DZF91_17440 [Actinomadura logoneensis]|uniref:DUF6286 domain-containing protein n=1 Tax=Actinomadura logoneensis TaxID=2293572 RepID=A0A372JK12_9ACTN|nr:hypothetical protein DZF91_17440 [Actinomadura logoneensis]
MLLTAAGTITAIEVVSGVAGHPARLVPYTRVADWMRHTSWTHWGVLAISAGLVLVGLWFLLAGLIPGRPRVVPLRGDDRDLAMAVTRGGFRNALAAAAEDVQDASRAQVTLRRHRVKVYVHCPAHAVDAVSEQVRRSVAGRLEEIRPLARYKVVVKPLTRKG